GVDRRIPLWTETVQAIKEAMANRPTPYQASYANLVFLTVYGRPWSRDTTYCPLSREFGKLLRRLGINGRRGLNFYSLRHTHRTIADGSRDQPACDMLMGHTRNDMASVYREGIDDSRLVAVVEHIHNWLFPQQELEDKPTILSINQTA